MRSHWAIRIAAPRPGAQSHARQIELMGFHGDDRRPIDIAADHQLIEGRSALILFESFEQFAFIAL